MDPDDILRDVNGKEYSYEAIATGNWLAGKCLAVDEIIHFIQRKAGDAFAAEKDDLAQTLRSLAQSINKEILTSMKKNLHSWKEDNPEILTRR